MTVAFFRLESGRRGSWALTSGPGFASTLRRVYQMTSDAPPIDNDRLSATITLEQGADFWRCHGDDLRFIGAGSRSASSCRRHDDPPTNWEHGVIH